MWFSSIVSREVDVPLMVEIKSGKTKSQLASELKRERFKVKDILDSFSKESKEYGLYYNNYDTFLPCSFQLSESKDKKLIDLIRDYLEKRLLEIDKLLNEIDYPEGFKDKANKILGY